MDLICDLIEPPPFVSLFKGTEILRVNIHAAGVHFRDGASWETGRYYFGVRAENRTCQVEGQNTRAVVQGVFRCAQVFSFFLYQVEAPCFFSCSHTQR